MNGIDWIRLYTDFFDNPKIRQIKRRKQKDGDTIICIWINLLCLAGKQNSNGVFVLTDDIPYTDEMVSNEMERNYDEKFKTAMAVLRQFKMIIDVDGVPTIKNWGVYQDQLEKLEKSKEMTRERVRRYREKQRAVLNNCNALQDRYNGVTKRNCNATVTHTDKEIDIDKDIDKEIYISKQASNLKENINNNARACERTFKREDYNDLLDEFGVYGEYRDSVFRFISHLKVNFNLVMLNERLENLIVKLDRLYDSDNDKVKILDDAIIKGYKRLECEQ